MNAIGDAERKIVNIYSTEFQPWPGTDSAASGESLLQLNESYPAGVGFHVYRMEPGTSSAPHRHTEDEEFYVLEGDLTDNDGTKYQQGDLVWLKKGTEHNSYTENGCTLIVYIKRAEVAVAV